MTLCVPWSEPPENKQRTTNHQSFHLKNMINSDFKKPQLIIASIDISQVSFYDLQNLSPNPGLF
jgi:hypothetical protein